MIQRLLFLENGRAREPFVLTMTMIFSMICCFARAGVRVALFLRKAEPKERFRLDLEMTRRRRQSAKKYRRFYFRPIE